MITALADALPEKQGAVLGGFVDLLAALRVGRIGEAEVAAVVDQACERCGRPRSTAPGCPARRSTCSPGRAVREARGDGRGDRARSPATTWPRSPREALRRGLLMTPGGSSADWAGYTAAPTTSAAAVEGTPHKAHVFPDRHLVTGAEGVSVIDDDHLATVRYDACAAVLAWPDGARRLIGHDGIIVNVEPTLYRDAAGVVAEIDAGVPRELRVDLPARGTDEIPQPRTSPGATAGACADRLVRTRVAA